VQIVYSRSSTVPPIKAAISPSLVIPRSMTTTYRLRTAGSPTQMIWPSADEPLCGIAHLVAGASQVSLDPVSARPRDDLHRKTFATHGSNTRAG
jgi:hypothetical protein